MRCRRTSHVTCGMWQDNRCATTITGEEPIEAPRQSKTEQAFGNRWVRRHSQRPGSLNKSVGEMLRIFTVSATDGLAPG
jgi:hypothetical protein